MQENNSETNFMEMWSFPLVHVSIFDTDTRELLIAEMLILDKEPNLPRMDTISCLAALRRRGKSMASLCSDVFRLMGGEGRVQLDEYFYYGLFDDERFSDAQKSAFIGRKTEKKVHQLTGNIAFLGVVHDKLVCYRVLESLGFRVPHSIALFKKHAMFDGIECISTHQELLDYLRNQANYPFFSKPVTGIRSVGTASFSEYRSTTDELVTASGEGIRVEDFVSEIESYGEFGYLFQECVTQHSELLRVCGPRLSTLRIIVLLEADGPRVYQALWKIVVGSNIADNFWRKGNLLASIDLEQGAVNSCVTGVGFERQEVERHPDTACSLIGFKIPFWNDVLDVCEKAAVVFPKLRMQAFDIAVSQNGPVVMEVNMGGDFNLPQLASGQGLLTPRFRAFLAHCAETRGLEGTLKKLRISSGK